jgi:drug/metabolite transporter (DMT)-like permease
MATLRVAKMINIGGRPVIVPSPRQSENTHVRKDSIKLGLAFLAIYVVWGSTYLAIRYAVETIPPLVTAGIRHSMAGGIMLTWAWWRGFRPTRQQWIAGLVLGFFFFFIGHGLLHWAERYVASGLSSLLFATEPMFILVMGWMMGQQKISGLSAIGLGVGIVGVATLTGTELTVKGSSLLGLMAVLLGSLSWALPTLCGAAMLLIAAGVAGEFQQTHWSSITARSLFGLGFLIVFGSVMAFTAYIWLLQRVSPTLVATHTYANPVVAVILGWLFAHEPLTVRVVIASTAILGAIVLIKRGEQAVAKSPRGVHQTAGIRESEECA